MFVSETIDDDKVELLSLLADGLIHESSAESILPYLDDDFPKDRLEEYVRTYGRPSQLQGFKENLKHVINSSTVITTQKLVAVLSLLNSGVASAPLTNSLTSVRNMSLKQREDLLKSWRDSILPPKRMLFKSIYLLCVSGYVRLATDLHNKAIGYPGKDIRQKTYESLEIDEKKLTMMEKPTGEGHNLFLPNIDVLIIGSGCGAGMVAHTLANSDYKSLVIEKGKYYSNSELNFDDLEGMSNLYQNGGAVISSNSQVTVLAGSNFGGGSTINWSACLRTPFKVRKEWYDDHGVDWAATDKFDECIDYSWKAIGATNEGINHSFSNQVILNGAQKLGYRVKEVAQNNGKHINHDCGFCHLGCKFGIKQGSVAAFFKDAYEKGTQFMDQVRVLRIIHKDGKATGALCQDTESGLIFTITGPKKFVVSGGSLNTPVILQNSGFKNKHIGANLKLHPITTIFGDFGKKTKQNAFNKAILTTVCNEFDDLDGKAHGAKIESLLHTPFIEAVFFPWDGSDEFKKDLLLYNNLSAIFAITRDTSSGTVTGDPRRPEALTVDYTINKYDREALHISILAAADILYIQGAKQILYPEVWVPVFKSDKNKEDRKLSDKDYAEWRKKASKRVLDPYGASYGSAHQMSSCRISGKGPSDGACDTNGRLYECKNIYVADASALPTASGVNPMISTLSVSRMIALEIVKDLQPQVKL